MCPICGKKQFARRDHFRTHVSTHNNQKLPCEVIPKLFFDILDVFHLSKRYFFQNLHNILIILKFCGKTFADNNKRRRHVIEVHEQRKNHMCNTCGKFS